MAKEAQHTPISHSSSPHSDFQGIFAGKTKLHHNSRGCNGNLVDLHGEQWYRISNFDQLNPFLITLPSVGDHWFFISSTGALTAGRKNADFALFPYMTDDQLHNAYSYSGSLTVVRVERSKQTLLWEPFSQNFAGVYKIERNIYKNVIGNKLLFEEFNHDLNLKFSYSWQCLNKYGFLRRSRIASTWIKPMRISVLDGIANILPSGVSADLQRSRSTLIDAYKVNELEQRIGVFSLSSFIVDHPVPEEALRSTNVWQHGPKLRSILLSLEQLEAFRAGKPLGTEHSILGQPGAYLVERNIRLTNERAMSWDLVADVNLDINDLTGLKSQMGSSDSTSALIKDLRRQEKVDTLKLQTLIAGADGLQKTAGNLNDLRHYTNVLFNSMRGGIPLNGYNAQKQDVIDFVTTRNNKLGSSDYFNRLPDLIDVTQLPTPDNPQIYRLVSEYLPLAYSRRHGDPSRPWNAFNINTHDEHGNELFDYSGNWRDLFQNWEALGNSFPRYYPSMLSTFVNASTADGYNPYRIGRNGVDWEIPDESDPWASIGYWGDHQLIYLLRILETTGAFNPDKLKQMMNLPIFSYVQVPYRLKNFEQILADPKHSVEFDWTLHQKIINRVANIGSDGRLLHASDGEPLLVTLAEKLLVPALTKLCAFVPSAGIWLNTQRPEWNDANNALAGWGCSLVTLNHLHNYLTFLQKLYDLNETYAISSEIADWLKETHQALKIDSNNLNSAHRFDVTTALGTSACNYRSHLYEHGIRQNTVTVSATFLKEFCTQALESIQNTLLDSITEDGLVHSYTILKANSDQTADVETLQLMLEGQVAALSSNTLTIPQAINLLRSLRKSPLYSRQQGTYLLYPDKKLPSFCQRNHINPNDLARLSVARKLINRGDQRLITKDSKDQYHFNADLVNSSRLNDILDTLISEGTKISDQDRSRILSLYEKIFNHNAFTGRSGRFFKYEGLGCVYWHMVSKLLLSVQDVFWKAIDTHAPEKSWKTLARQYYDIRDSLGSGQTPAKYGAFPQDAYSHTPKWGGAHQPGLTGQVKEDIIARWGELGLRIKDGILSIHPALLRKSEFLKKDEEFKWYNLDHSLQSMQLHQGQIAFTYCQTLFVYHLSQTPKLTLRGELYAERTELTLSIEESAELFSRTGKISRVDIFLSPWS
ncbi:MAG: hypothetical protein OXE59_01965 [Bacteroidetes bacterium]|nr:hypothetical protein [Bacteroidota bacterium]